MNTLQRVVKELAKEHDMKKKDVAMKMGIHPNTLSNSLSRKPKNSTLERIAKVFNMDIEEFISLIHKPIDFPCAITTIVVGNTKYVTYSLD